MLQLVLPVRELISDGQDFTAFRTFQLSQLVGENIILENILRIGRLYRCK